MRKIPGFWAWTLGFAILGILPSTLRCQSIKSFSGWQGTTLRIDFGGLEKVGRSVRPCQIHQEIEYSEAALNTEGGSPQLRTSAEPSPETLRGRAFVERGMAAFSEARWAEAADLLRQALALLPEDPAVQRTLASALIGLGYEEAALRSDEQAARQAAEDSVRVGLAIERLSDTLNAIRLEASQSLIDQGQFQNAVSLSGHTDFITDSSVVDLREARQGVVNIEALRPPDSRSGRIEFARPPRSPATPVQQRARRFLADPAVEAVMFNERAGEAVGYLPAPSERQDRYADPVQRAVADYLHIDLRNATAAERDYVEQKTREVWNVYDDSRARQEAACARVAQQSLQAFNQLVEKLTREGILKPGENLRAREQSDPTFRELMASEVRAIVLEDDVGRREVTQAAFGQLLGSVSAVLERKGQR
jgi:tetratricopeptide (TPR) repeat protein